MMILQLSLYPNSFHTIIYSFSYVVAFGYIDTGDDAGTSTSTGNGTDNDAGADDSKYFRVHLLSLNI